MIHLTRLSHSPLVLNADLIETIEATPDTTIGLTTGQKLVVLESAGEVVRRVVEFRRAVYMPLGPSIPAGPGAPSGEPVDGGEAG
jgi:flagellar protein FlbD